MLASAIVSDVQNHGFTDISSADILLALNQVYQDLCSIESWPFLEKTLTTTFSITNPQFASATDIKQILSLVNTVQGYELVPMRSDDFFKQYSNVLSLVGMPVLYHQPSVNATAPNGWSVSCWPIPQAATACQLRYLYIPPDLTAPDTPVLPARFHRILTWGTLVSIYQMEDDSDSSIRFQGLYDRMLARMRDDLWSRQFDLNDSILDVTNDSDFDAYY